jgi:hypothetical protein
VITPPPKEAASEIMQKMQAQNGLVLLQSIVLVTAHPWGKHGYRCDRVAKNRRSTNMVPTTHNPRQQRRQGVKQNGLENYVAGIIICEVHSAWCDNCKHNEKDPDEYPCCDCTPCAPQMWEGDTNDQ